MKQETFVPGPALSLNNAKALEVTLCLFSKKCRCWISSLLSAGVGQLQAYHLKACENAGDRPHPRLLYQNLHFNKSSDLHLH